MAICRIWLHAAELSRFGIKDGSSLYFSRPAAASYKTCLLSSISAGHESRSVNNICTSIKAVQPRHSSRRYDRYARRYTSTNPSSSSSLHSIESKLKCKFGYFLVLNCDPIKFNVDVPVLEKTHRSLQSEFHPDKVLNQDPKQKQQRAEISMHLSNAINVLRHPYKRAEYLMSELGYPLEEQDDKLVEPEFLMEMLEFQEQLEDMQGSGNDEDEQRHKQNILAEWRNRLNELCSESESILSRIFDGSRNTASLGSLDPADLHTAKVETARLQYLERVRSRIRELSEVE